MINFLDQLDIEKLKKEDIQMMNPLVLSYIGDAVYDMYIRTYIVLHCTCITVSVSLLV